MPWPFWFRFIKTAIWRARVPMPICRPYSRPYSTCAASISPPTRRSRMPVQDSSRLSSRRMPYFSSKPSTDAITSGAQSASGM
jgi:hypothetical protein